MRLTFLLGAAALALTTSAGAQQGGRPQLVASFPDQVTGVAVSETGRTFVNFPRWTSDVPTSVAEVLPNGSTRPYPDARWNGWRNANKNGLDPAAHFVCSLAIAWPNDGQTETFDGRVDGTLVWPPRGERGFGYDPMFVPAGYEQTFGEMDQAEKHRISHRARAFAKLAAALK